MKTMMMLRMMKIMMMMMHFNSNIQFQETSFRSLIHDQSFLGHDVVDFGSLSVKG